MRGWRPQGRRGSNPLFRSNLRSPALGLRSCSVSFGWQANLQAKVVRRSDARRVSARSAANGDDVGSSADNLARSWQATGLAVATLDADVLVAVPGPNRLDVLAPIYDFCRSRGYQPEGEAIRVGAWPVRFSPVFDELTKAALAAAETADFEGEPFRVVDPVHLAVIALATGRAKDLTRILALLDAGAVTREQVTALAARHGLADAWNGFVRRFLDDAR